jgi:hypothetical protein
MSTSSTLRFLSGNKEIALCLEVSTKTVQRYLKFLPVIRFGSSKVIFESDLVKWMGRAGEGPMGRF